jgi:hypothetical protein
MCSPCYVHGQSLKKINRFSPIDFLVPDLVFTRKEFKRECNQLAFLCAVSMKCPSSGDGKKYIKNDTRLNANKK